MTSKHYNRDRVAREKLIREIGIGKEIKTVRVDKGHPNHNKRNRNYQKWKNKKDDYKVNRKTESD